MSTVKKTTLLLIGMLALGWSASAQAQLRRGGVVVGPRVHVYSSYWYDPFWGGVPYGFYPYYAYPGGVSRSADVRVQVAPKQAQVYVDGYFAGTADQLDGVFKRLHTTPGGHAITLHLNGYRTVTENVYVRRGDTFKLHETLQPLAPGEVSAPPPEPASPRAAAQTPRDGAAPQVDSGKTR